MYRALVLGQAGYSVGSASCEGQSPRSWQHDCEVPVGCRDQDPAQGNSGDGNTGSQETAVLAFKEKGQICVRPLCSKARGRMGHWVGRPVNTKHGMGLVVGALVGFGQTRTG